MNRKIIGLVGVAAALLLSTGCFRNTVSTIELNIPAMKTEACVQAIESALGRLGDGAIQDIAPDVGVGKMVVTFDNVRLGRRNIEVAVRHAGFAVNDLPADEEARAKLSPECRGDE